MTIEQVKDLMREMTACGLTELSWSGEGVKLRLARSADAPPAAQPFAAGDPARGSLSERPSPAAKTASAADAAAGAAAEPQPEAAGKPVKSPVVGVFYAAASPDADPFVQVGQTVKKGDVLCIIEAMKLMNEVVSDVDGVVRQILVSNDEKIEYGQTLMVIG